MGSSERRQRQKRELREKILDAARELFAKQGYEAVTMRKIAEKIEYSPTSIYLCFPNKKALVRELCTKDFLELARRFNAIRKHPDPFEMFRAIGRSFLEFASEYPDHYRMMFMTQHPPITVEDREIEKGNAREDAWAFIVGDIEQAQKAGLLRTDLGGPSVLAQLYFAGLHGIAALHLVKADDPWIKWSSAEELTDKMIHMLLRGSIRIDSQTQQEDLEFIAEKRT